MRLLKAIPIFILIAGTAVYAGGRQDAAAAEHVLNRLGYGARPGDVERVLAMGIDRYIESQLNPRAISDASVTARLAAFHTLDLDSREITEQACRNCHGEIVGAIEPAHPAPAGGQLACLRCHDSVGHL